MPRGGKKGHKGRGKQFSNPEEIDRQMKAQREREENEGAEEKESGSESEEETSSSDDEPKRKGVEGLIEIENPNRVSHKSKKVAELDVSAKEAPRELSRREREEIEKQQAKERYMKLHLEGKTEQARADLARLAIIKKQREDAAKKREEQRKAKEEQSKAKR
ncbi:hypothetical protein ACEWY4_025746 [Coilia grayii]|uniref:Casein kinase substrate phosphoprotein PP28 domain-containing protein n=1 Tax=Coilia grayii TaxID=363190 RepID=A0ABD1IUW3_9TELE